MTETTNRVYGDVLTYLRILGAKKWRASEETPEGRLENVVPGLGLFHFMWEIQKIILDTWWGAINEEGTLGWFKNTLGHNSADKAGGKFTYCDELMNDAVRGKMMEVYTLVNKKPLLTETPDKEEVVKVIDFVFKFHSNSADQFAASFLQAGLLYIEVSFKTSCVFVIKETEPNL